VAGNEQSNEGRRIGLCGDCTHARRITSDRGATFYQCGLAATDPSFPKYPRLPVLECRGYAPADAPKRDC
jgi:hypothetical protein